MTLGYVIGANTVLTSYSKEQNQKYLGKVAKSVMVLTTKNNLPITKTSSSSSIQGTEFLVTRQNLAKDQ